MDKQQTASRISGGIFLVCLGVLIITGWWWPGIWKQCSGKRPCP